MKYTLISDYLAAITDDGARCEAEDTYAGYADQNMTVEQVNRWNAMRAGVPSQRPAAKYVNTFVAPDGTDTVPPLYPWVGKAIAEKRFVFFNTYTGGVVQDTCDVAGAQVPATAQNG